MKHSPGAAVKVSLQHDADVIRHPWGDLGGGFGLDGLRTRVAAVGGTLESGPTPQGWLLVALLPWAEADRP